MEVNPLRRVLTAKATPLVGLAMLVAVVMLVIASMDSVSQAQQKPKSQFGAKEVIATSGSQGFPITGTYKSKGGKLLIWASGSGYSNTGGKQIGITVSVDGARIGTAWSYTNENLSHKAFVPAAFVVKNKPAGQLKIELDKQGFPDTTIDGNDNFKVTVLEIPK
jgi:hypothetical protein